MFATHYHELTALAQRHKGIANVTVRVKEWHGGIVFLHEVVPGAADRSYGIQVAKLAGLPSEVLSRAQEVLDALEAGDMGRRTQTLIDELPLFSAARKSSAAAAPPSAVEAELRALALDELTPRQALEALYRLKALAQGGNG